MLTCTPRRGARGFTIIELVIAIALVGTLLKLGVPSFVAWVRNAQVRTVADALQNGVRLAQSEAVRRNRSVVLSLTNAQPAQDATAAANGKFWSVQFIPQFGDSTTSPNLFIQGGALTDVASGVAIQGPAAICINSTGRMVAQTAANTRVGAACSVSNSTYNITLTGADRPLRVTVGLGGQMRLCDPNRPSTAPDGC